MKSITAQERDILVNVYGIQDPDEVLRGSDPDAIQEVKNVLSVLREDIPGANFLDLIPGENKPITITRDDCSLMDQVYNYPPGYHYRELRERGPAAFKWALDVAKRRSDAAYKAESEGILSLTPDERRLYSSYLFSNLYKIDKYRTPVKPIHANIADFVVLEHKMIVVNQEVYIYDDETGVYLCDYKGTEVKKHIRDNLEREFIEDKLINAIYNLILSDSRIQVSESRLNNRPKHWIHFLNGYYDHKTESFIAHNPDYFEIGVVPWEYDPVKYPSMYRKVKSKNPYLEYESETLFFDEWIESVIPDMEDRIMLLDYIAYAMTLDTSAQKFMLICGPGGTGKSTLLKLIEEIIGRSNISSISLQGLQDRFSPAGLFLKQANVCADIPLTALSEVDVIKKLTGEDTVSADRKFKNAFTFRSYARLFFSANDIPFIGEKTNAFYRRMLILKMDRTPDRVDPTIIDRLIPEIPNIISKIVEWYTVDEGDILVSDNCRDAVKTARKDSDTIEAFLDDKCEIGDEYRVSRAEVYRAYYNYCVAEERKSVTNRNFYRELEKRGFKINRSKTSYDIVGLRLSNTITIFEIAEKAAI